MPTRPFCANTKCFMHAMEVPDSQQTAEIGLPNGMKRTLHRDYLVVKKDGRKYPLCDTCGNVMRVIMGEGEDLPPGFGMSIDAHVVDPHGNIVHSDEPELPEGLIHVPSFSGH